MRGKLPDPNKARRNTQVALVKLNDQPIPTPRMPAGLSPTVKRRWRNYWSSDVARAVTEVDVPIVLRLFWLYERFENERDELPIPHLQKLVKLISECELQLGLTPMARARLGISFSEAKMTLAQVREVVETR